MDDHMNHDRIEIILRRIAVARVLVATTMAIGTGLFVLLMTGGAP